MHLPLTPSQTVGPFLRIGLPDHEVRVPAAAGSILLAGRIIDGLGAPVTDAVVEIWQADPQGRYAVAATAQDFHGFGRCATDAEGMFRFRTVRPGADAAGSAPHLLVAIFMRGLLKHLVTRMYFPDAPENAGDPVLQQVPEARRASLVATAGEGGYRWDIILQDQDAGRETVFFDL